MLRVQIVRQLICGVVCVNISEYGIKDRKATTLSELFSLTICGRTNHVVNFTWKISVLRWSENPNAIDILNNNPDKINRGKYTVSGAYAKLKIKRPQWTDTYLPRNSVMETLAKFMIFLYHNFCYSCWI